MTVPDDWNQSHTADFKALQDALHAIINIDITGTTHTDWLLTVRTVRDKISTFGLFIPHAAQLTTLLNAAEKVLLGLVALANLAEDA